MAAEKKTITIGKPYTYIENSKAYLKAPIAISEDSANAYMRLKNRMHKVHWRVDENYPPLEWKQENFGCWFAVDMEYAQYLHTETVDAFVAAMLWYAITTGSDLVCEAPISEQMLFSIENLLIPALCTENNGYRRISITGPTAKVTCKSANGVGTGMSCGIDSFYTLWKYADIEPKERRLTHLTYFNMGAIFHPDSSKKTHYSVAEFYKKTDEMSVEKIDNAKKVADRVGLPLVAVSSNLDSDIYRGAYGYTAVYRNCACVLALQKLFNTYYCSSAGWPDYFDLTLSEGSEHYEALLCQCLSTESCSFVLSDYVTRIEKTKAIADYSPAWEYLDVCFNFHNCGHCAKCYRTLLTLDILGAIDSFKPVFDVDNYKSNRAKAYGWLLHARHADAKEDNGVFARDIYRLAKKNHVYVPRSAYVYELKNTVISILVKIKHWIQYSRRSAV